MARKLASNVAELLSRAEADMKPKNDPAQTFSRTVTQTPQRPVPQARREVYNGDPQAKTPGYAVRSANKRVVPKKRRSTFNIVAVLFLSAIAIIAYIGNILTVNQLAVEVHQLQAQYGKIQNANSVLKAEINRKSAWQRIGNTAKEQLGMTYAKERPQSFDVDEDKLDEFKDK